MTLGTKIRSNRHLRQTCIYMIAQSVPLQTKGHTRAMCIYTMGRRPPLPSSESQLEISEVSTDQKKTSVHVFQFKIGQATDLCSRHPNASHPQDDECKGKKKNRDLQEKDRLSCKFREITTGGAYQGAGIKHFAFQGKPWKAKTKTLPTKGRVYFISVLEC